jgi:5-methylcytosine-specific restriction protein A
MPTKPKAKQLFSKQTKPKYQRWSATNDNRYHSNRWRNLRLEKLKENPLCVECAKQGLTTLATVGDHINPVRLGGEFWDKENIQGLCESCHNKKSAKESKL